MADADSTRISPTTRLLTAETERLRAAFRGALPIADEQSKENVELRAEIARVRAQLNASREAR